MQLQLHVNNLNDGWDLRSGDRMKMSLQAVGKGFSFLRV